MKIEDTEVQVIKSAQREAFPEEYLALQRRKELPKNSKLLAFRPRLDEEGQMRCDSQLKYAEFLSHDARFPIILPRKHQVTKLIVKGGFMQCKWNESDASSPIDPILDNIWK